MFRLTGFEVGSAAEADIAENLVAGNHQTGTLRSHHNNISWRYVAVLLGKDE